MYTQRSQVWFYLEVCLCGPALLYLFLRDRVLSQKQKDTSPTLKEVLLEQSSALWRRLVFRRPRPSTLPDMARMWDAGCGLQGESAGVGQTCLPSCSSSVPRAVGTVTPSLATMQAYSSSARIGGKANGIPIMDPRTYTTVELPTMPTAGPPGPGSE